MSELLSQFQQIEQNLQVLLSQKQALDSKKIECEHALSQLVEGEDCYKFLGSILIKTNASDVISDLTAQKAQLSKRIDSLAAQETQMREVKTELEKQILG